MLKRYLKRGDKTSSTTASVAPVAAVSVASYCPAEDGLIDTIPVNSCGELKNSVILRDLYNTLSYLTDCQRKELLQLIDKYPSLFADVPGRISVLTHDIDVGDSLPIKQNAYRVNPKKLAIMEEIEYMLRHDIAIPSQSPWSSPCLLVPKPDSSFRFCTDYRKISAFVTPDHFMEYKVLAFGMRNAPATFQHLMQRVLVGVTNCEVYIDDVVVYSNSWEEHVKALEDVFMEAILQFPTPSNKRELCYYRGFCRNFSAVVSPLTDLLSSSRKFIWDSSCSLAFDAVKDLLCNAPVLSAPNFEKSFKLQAEASATGAGAMLLQEDEHDVDHPISYFSKKFTSYQRRYSTIEKEALTLLLELQHFDVYIGGSDRFSYRFSSRIC
ncbi:Retrovirus-related Pol polyprotein from transposon 17.6 [Labeo rohita]|uniref:ribonuclease H n=1 Tax=Labeo rohita TaxID=84645 RepID=A0ABQ8L3V1_LABRO|nr:Retrovirus-related Pol polyprotein from transposon 17.6 [Labeo rohita]